MELLFVGTGAADWPREYAGDPMAAVRGETRGFASLLIDQCLLIDCGPTVPAALRMLKAPLGQISDLLITHGHGDHLDPAALSELAAARTEALARGAAAYAGSSPLRVWADAGAAGSIPRSCALDVRPLVAHTPVEVAGLSVLSLPANHEVAAKEQALHFLIERDGTRCLYATDGAWLLRETWSALRDRPLDALVWDGTIGEMAGDWRIFEHNSVDMIRVMLQSLRPQGVVDAHTRILLTHMARTLCAPHAQMAARLVPEGLVPAYDGMRVELLTVNRPEIS